MIRPKLKFLSALVVFGIYAGLAQAQQNPSQQELTGVLRQLEQIQSTVAHQASLPVDARSRYDFDYQRLHHDLTRIRAGIEHYLTPERAQPRDPVELIGNYQHEPNRSQP